MHIISYNTVGPGVGKLEVIFTTGQSLSIGSPGSSAAAEGVVPLSITQPYRNVMPSTTTGLLVPLVEPVYGVNAGGVESPVSGCLNLLSELVGGSAEGADDEPFAGFTVGKGGATYSVIKKGGTGTEYQDGLDIVTTLMGITGEGAQVNAVIMVHGESDHILGTANYDTLIEEFASDWDTDLRAITGQTETIPLFTCQMSAWTGYDAATSEIPIMQRAAAINNDNIYLVCPKYHLTYIDNQHLTTHGYRQLGEHYAKAIYLQRYGGDWQPLEPINIARVGAVITITFNVPSGGLVLDTTRVSDPGNYGFEYTDDTGSADIASVVLSGTNKVSITLNTTPTGANRKIRYAYTGVIGNDPGPLTGARGCLRDNDLRYTSRHGYALYNWCVIFEEAVP